MLAMNLVHLGGCQDVQPEDEQADQPSTAETIVERRSPWASNSEYSDTVLAIPLDDNDRKLLETYNWRTRRPFTQNEVRRLKHLNLNLPGNRSLMAINPETRLLREEERRANRTLGERIDQGKGTQEDIRSYYDFKVDYYEDRIAVLDFVLSERNWDLATQERYERYRDVARTERTKLEMQRTGAIARLTAETAR